MLEGKVLIVFLLFLNTVSANISLSDHVVKMEHVILSVEYNHRHLNVWKETSHGYNRFFVTPLCTLDTSSITCSKDEFSNEHRHIFAFNVKIWDSFAAETIKLALSQKNISATVTDILPLPMLLVRLGIGEDVTENISVSKQWRSNQDQPNIISFELYTRHEHYCDKMLKKAKTNPEEFLARTKLSLDFTMVVAQHASRSIKVNGETFVNSKFLSNLDHKHKNKSIIYLTSSDMNKLARDIYRTATLFDEVTSTYLPSEQESSIISELLEVIKGQTVHLNDLTKEEQNSVFWSDTFSRPDVQTEYLNEVLEYDEGEKHFKYDAKKDRAFSRNLYNKSHHEHETRDKGGFDFSISGLFGFGANDEQTAKTVSDTKSKDDVKTDSKQTIKLDASYEDTENSKSKNKEKNETIKISKNTLTLDDLQKHLNKHDAKVKWTGTKFTPKDLLLYRLNSKTLKSSGEVFYKRIVTKKLESTQKFELRAETQNQTNPDKTISPIYYEELKRQFINLKEQLDNATNELDTIRQENNVLRNKLPTPPSHSSGPKTCPPDWSFYNVTGFCYKVFVIDADWHSAENGCRHNQAHLASVHSLEEAKFVGGLAYSPGADLCDPLKQAWIGLYSNDNNFSWQWTDGTPFDYSNWGHQQPDIVGQRCVHIFSAPNNCNWFLADFDNYACFVKFSRHVCKKAPI